MPPVTVIQQTVLDALSPDGDVSPADIVGETGMSHGSVAAALYSLQRRGLAFHLGYRLGWVRE